MMVTTILMLYGTVTNIIAIVGLGLDDHKMLANEKQDIESVDEEEEEHKQYIIYPIETTCVSAIILIPNN
ncbi:hypothetical protein ACWGOQ_0002610 [Aquimarina sp. M1]